MSTKVITNTTKNHRTVVTRHGGPDVLNMIEEELPEPQAGEVRVRVQAAGVSAYDLMFRSSGSLPGTPSVPFTLGTDVAGIVDKLGVGSALLELGKLAGLEMYGTASGPKHGLVSALGATPIEYRTEDVVARIRALTSDGVDVVFDPIGGARQLWRSKQALRKGGRLVWFGVAATKKDGLRVIPITLLMVGLLKLLPDGKRLLTTPDLGSDNAWYRATLAKLLDMLAAGEINPVVSERVPLVESARAHELLENGEYAGRVVLVTDSYLD